LNIFWKNFLGDPTFSSSLNASLRSAINFTTETKRCRQIECPLLLRRSRACFQSKTPFLIRKCTHLVVSAHINLEVKHLTQVCEGEKQSHLVSTILRHCGSGDEYGLWYFSATNFCLFCVVGHHVLKMTFHHNVKKNLFHISTNISAFLRYTGWPEGPETDSVASSHPIYRVFR